MSEDQGKSSGVGAERRASARIPVEMWVQEISPAGLVFRRAGNLSSGGMYLDQTIPIPVGSSISLRFDLPGDDNAITVSGQIVSIRTSEALGMGVKFTEVDRADQERIDQYLSRSLTPAAAST